MTGTLSVFLSHPIPRKEHCDKMSTTAETWFYNEPENQAYLIGERLNASFWQARAVNTYWKVVRDEPPYVAHGYQGEEIVELEWVPREWLTLRAPADAETDRLAEVISKRILATPATFSYVTHDGRHVYEWHRGDAAKRWNELQGRYEVSQLKRLR